MTKQELIDTIAKKHGDLTKKAITEVVDDAFDTIAKTVKKEKKFSFPGFGTFEVRTRKARKGRNPQTGDVIKIKASKTVAFRPAKALKDRL